MSDTVFEIKDLQQHYKIGGGLFNPAKYVYAVDGVSFSLKAGETLGLVGESGCGKSSVGRTLLKLHDPTGGKIFFEGRDITNLSQREMVSLRKELQIVFQDPMESLNVRHTIGNILEEPFEIHGIGTKAERRQWAKELLVRVGLQESAIDRYPHEFSGGQRQRIGIARAIALKPKLIVCDEAVSALDVSVQSQVINLLLELQEELNLALIFIAHDLSVVRHISDRIAVMYLGKIVEMAEVETLFDNPKHPYTQALISAIPVPDPRRKGQRIILQGDVPSPLNPPAGCHFASRCRLAEPPCQSQRPVLKGDDHQVACHLAV
ncbi:ABC transporter ATP-binding protein [Thaumasiovibrio subtropicus]|uniref:ABC transporter ATP-binding protein n=1 Tax=Thaumasiovibrio subtropicus TaxID=1891207 RepID=UPI000B35F25E|nr:dipeptide ABC transporter ATP-binding protein [Thaumasiovibrio subtropicus]